jgi:FkbM family methyltransferase
MNADWQHDALREGVQIFGAGRFARDLAIALQQRGVRVLGLLTSGTPQQDIIDGLPCHAADAVNLARTPVWIGVFNREAHSDYARLQLHLQHLCADVRLIWPQIFYGWLHEQLGFRFWLHPTGCYETAAAEIEQARALLDDESSRTAFDRVLAFRRDASAHFRPPLPETATQYLPAWLCAHLQQSQGSPLRIVDAGAYRGETLHELDRLLPIEQAWTFEPDADNHSALVASLTDWPGMLTHLPAGLSDRTGWAAFTPGAGEASHFSPQGSHRVPVVALDDCLHQAPINFIKLDVEGHELAALAGARRTLQRQRPTLAIAAYHRWDDLWRIPLFVAQTGLGYRLRLGLHAHNSFDAVHYAFHP